MNNFFKLENIDKNISVSLLGKQKDPRQLEFEFPDQNRELKKQSDSKEVPFEKVSQAFHKAVRFIISVYINLRLADFTENESLQEDLLFLSDLIREMVVENQGSENNIEINFLLIKEIKMNSKKKRLIDEINNENYVDYGFWLLFDRFHVDALKPGFFDVNANGVKTAPWCFYAICSNDLGWTDNVIYDPEPRESDFDRDFITDSQAEAFSAVMTSIYAADLRQDEIKLGDDSDGPDSDEQVAIWQIRNRLDVVAADLLKFGPFDSTVLKTLEIRLDFIKLLLTNRHAVLPSLGLAPDTDLG